MDSNTSAQDAYLSQLRESGTTASFIVMNGFQFQGTISSFDDQVIIVDTDRGQQMVYKHALSTVRPAAQSDGRSIGARPFIRR